MPFSAKRGCRAMSSRPPWPLATTAGTPADRPLDQAAALDQAQPAVTLGHQHPPVGQERQRPGMLQATGDLDQPEAGGGGLRARAKADAAAAAGGQEAHRRAEQGQGEQLATVHGRVPEMVDPLGELASRTVRRPACARARYEL